MADVTVGSIWRDNDKRAPRIVRVIDVLGQSWVKVRECTEDGSKFVARRCSTVRYDRFPSAFTFVQAFSRIGLRDGP